MRTSVCITVKNEPLRQLLTALEGQTHKPDEVIIIDASVNPKFKYQNSKQFLNIKFINSKNISRAKARNLAVKTARNGIIAMTDAGCVPRKDWLEKITAPYNKVHPRAVQGLIVAGFYRMVYKNNLQKGMRVYMGVTPEKYDHNFLPSTRSIAFSKSVWKKVGGFNQKLDGAGEDTEFNVKWRILNAKCVRVKNAVVDWQMPKSIYEFYLKIFEYAKGDAQTRLLMSHNIHSLFVLLRTFLAFIFLAFIFWNNWKLAYWYLFVFIGIYLFYSYKKAGLWGILLQPVSDIAVIYGFLSGIASLRLQ